MVGPIAAEHDRSKHQMVTIDCPWCAEAVDMDGSSLDELACRECGITVEIAPDPIRALLDQAA
jgi:heterodisulfide reductase subunit A-like polyferredoxin